MAALCAARAALPRTAADIAHLAHTGNERRRSQQGRRRLLRSSSLQSLENRRDARCHVVAGVQSSRPAAVQAEMGKCLQQAPGRASWVGLNSSPVGGQATHFTNTSPLQRVLARTQSFADLQASHAAGSLASVGTRGEEIDPFVWTRPAARSACSRRDRPPRAAVALPSAAAACCPVRRGLLPWASLGAGAATFCPMMHEAAPKTQHSTRGAKTQTFAATCAAAPHKHSRVRVQCNNTRAMGP